MLYRYKTVSYKGGDLRLSERRITRVPTNSLPVCLSREFQWTSPAVQSQHWSRGETNFSLMPRKGPTISIPSERCKLTDAPFEARSPTTAIISAKPNDEARVGQPLHESASNATLVIDVINIGKILHAER